MRLASRSASEPQTAASPTSTAGGSGTAANGRSDAEGIDRRKTSVTMRRVSPTLDLSSTEAREHEFPNDYGRVTQFVDELLAPGKLDTRGAIRDELSLALRELLLNAIEHGNLGLSFEDKSRALEDGSWKGLVASRAGMSPYGERRVRVTAHWRADRVVFALRDEGNGFDWQTLPDPTDPNSILCDHGRGILMARVSVDALYFNAVGNEVTIVKQLSCGEPSELG